ncbi:hypothetical protein B0H11DRAFT_1899627 [Mycena galericulata]|nr:hypothetical protein B0H11DRAFT_1899627 [Mycena galericulata]
MAHHRRAHRNGLRGPPATVYIPGTSKDPQSRCRWVGNDALELLQGRKWGSGLGERGGNSGDPDGFGERDGECGCGGRELVSKATYRMVNVGRTYLVEKSAELRRGVGLNALVLQIAPPFIHKRKSESDKGVNRPRVSHRFRAGTPEKLSV